MSKWTVGMGVLLVGLSLWYVNRGQDLAGRLQIDSPLIDEGSGLAASHRNINILWTHNDSGDSARIFAITPNGRLRGEFSIHGIEATDWEAITTDLDGHLYIGDIGNNRNERRDLVVYQIDEPHIPLGGPVVQGQINVKNRYRFHYPEQTRFPDRNAMNFDAEALFWAPHPATGIGTLYLLTKHRSDTLTALYRFDSLDSQRTVPLHRVGTYDVGGDPDNFGGMVTGADATSDGQTLAVLTYHSLLIFERSPLGDDYLTGLVNRIHFDQGVTGQVEAVAWLGGRLIFTNEAGDIFEIPKPKTYSSSVLFPHDGSPPASTVAP